MNIVVRGHNVEVTDALQQYAKEKAEKIEHFFNNIQETIVELNFSHTSAKAKRQVAQITSWVAGSVVRAEESSEDMYASIDLAVDKIERQLKKYKDKLHSKHRKEAMSDKLFIADHAIADEHRPQIIRTKQFTVKPMTPTEAALQMQLIHHDFFVFQNADADNSTCVIYQRQDGNFGLLQPE